MMKEDAGLSAARDLARLMERKLGLNEGRIDSIALRLFILAYGEQMSFVVNTIRDDQD